MNFGLFSREAITYEPAKSYSPAPAIYFSPLSQFLSSHVMKPKAIKKAFSLLLAIVNSLQCEREKARLCGRLLESQFKCIKLQEIVNSNCF